MQSEDCSSLVRRLDRDAPFMSLHVTLDEAQAKSCARVRRTVNFLPPIERLEDMRQVCRGNARSMIGDDNLHFRASARARAVRGHAQPLAISRVLERITYQILNHAFKRLSIGQNKRQLFVNASFNLPSAFFKSGNV